MDHLQNVMGYFDQQQPLCAEHDRIAKDLYREFGVKAGLRDENGKGVLAGLTNISDIRAFQYVNGVKKPADGQLLYRGYDVKDLIRGSSGSRFAFEEAAYLLLFGELPTQEKLEEFCRVLGECRTMPTNFTRDVIMKAPSHDIMIRIGGQDFPLEVVKSRLLKLNSEHISYVVSSLKSNTTKVRNIRAYLLTALYNAPTTISSYYTALVNHDLYGGG